MLFFHRVSGMAVLALKHPPSLHLIRKIATCMSAGLAVSVFENYAVLQRPLQPLLKALERVDWASFGLAVQASASPPCWCSSPGSVPSEMSGMVLYQCRIGWDSEDFMWQRSSPDAIL